MKSLTQIAPNLQRAPQTRQSQISPSAAYDINDVFKSLKATLSAFRVAFQNDEDLRLAKKSWTKALIENGITTHEQIAKGMRKARQQETDFVPSAGKFISWCKPSAEDLGLTVDGVSLEIDRYQNRMTGETVEFSHWVVEEITIKHGFSLKRAQTKLRNQIIADELSKWAKHIQDGGLKPERLMRIESNQSKSYAEQINYEPTSFAAKALMDRIDRNKKGDRDAA